ncbi:MAG: hypothetical protein ACK595_04550 [Planctomycetota bacterium]
MTLPNEEVKAMLAEQFVLAARNIQRDPHVGMSHGYRCDQSAVGTTNGAGGRNVQLLLLAADETVLHALPGYWHAADLLPELRLGLELFRLYVDDDRPTAARDARFAALHRSHVRRHGEAAAARGAWQSFDASHERQRADFAARDTSVPGPGGMLALKDIPSLVHDRMLARPFRQLADFDLEAFVDYGRPFYDNNPGTDRRREFPLAERANRKRAVAQQKVATLAAAATKAVR